MPKNDGWSEPILIEIDRIDPRPASEVRHSQDDAVIQEYAENFDALPPIKVVADKGDKHWCPDGFKRLEAAKLNGRTRILAQVTSGDYFKAFHLASRANDGHGVRTSREDKQRRVVFALNHPVMGKWSQHRIAEYCCVTQQMVSLYDSRATTNNNGQSSIGKDGVTRTSDGRSNDQKREQVIEALRRYADWSNTKIAEHVAVSRDMVRKIRSQLGESNTQTEATATEETPAPSPLQTATLPPPETAASPANSAGLPDTQTSAIPAGRPEPEQEAAPPSWGLVQEWVDESVDSEAEVKLATPVQVQGREIKEESAFDEAVAWARAEAVIMREYQSWPEGERAGFVMSLGALKARLQSFYHPEIRDRSREALPL